MPAGDSFKILTNSLADTTRLQINRNSKRMFTEMQRLSTGSKLNKAEDDSASFSIAAKVAARLAGLEQAENNVYDAKSMMDIMERSMSKVLEIMVQVRKYVLQAANAVHGTQEREFIRQSINGLANEITSIINQTVYNGQNLLEKGYSATFQVGEHADDIISIVIEDDLKAQDVQVEEVSSIGVLTSSSQITTSTRLNNLNQFKGFQSGDTFEITLTKGDGTQVSTQIIGNGAKGQLSTNTIQDVMNAINGIGGFTATFDASEGGQIVVRETVITEGNALAVSIGDFVEAPNLDGATGAMNFSFNAASGALRSNLSGGGAITTSTNINSLNQFNIVEGQDSLSVQLRDRDGVNYTVSLTFGGAAGTATTSTVGDIINAINAQAGSKFAASLVSGQIQIAELNKSQKSMNVTASYIENNTNTGAASVHNISFARTVQSVKQQTLGNITGTTALSDVALGIGSGFDAGDTFEVRLRDNTGANTTLTYTFTGAGDTYQDLASFINSNSNFVASISGGEFLIREQNQHLGNQLSATYLNYSGVGTLSNPGFTINDTFATANGSFGSPGTYNGSSLLNNLVNFTNVQEGDQLVVRLTDNSGAAQSATFTFAGAQSGASTSTLNNLITAINSQTNLVASFDSGINELKITDPNHKGNSINLSISNADFTEKPRALNGGINLSFSYQNEKMESNQLTTGGSNVSASTKLTQIDGWGTLEGNDVIRINLRTRANANGTYNFTLNDVAPGNTSNMTVGDLVNYLDSRVIGAVNFKASLQSGHILIEEENSPNVGGFSASSSFAEKNIDITPKLFAGGDFQIKKFLGLASDTGLVIGLGLIDFDSGTLLTQNTAMRLLKNVDDSIARLNNQVNQLGVSQTRLTNREISIRSSIISNESGLSRLRDADFAKTYSAYLKTRILQQYQNIALTQANVGQAHVLALL